MGVLDQHSNFTLIGFRNGTVFDQENLPCYEINQLDWEFADNFAFWVEGIFQCIFAAAGIFGNSISTFILFKKNMRNSFNSFIIALMFMDTCYLIGAILESFRKCFNLASYLHIHMFPYFLYPGINIAFTSSVIMRVAIAIERYITVHHPIEHRRQINNTDTCRRRLMKYVIAVMLISIVVNIPKFLDSQVQVEYKNITYPAEGLSLTPITTIDSPTYELMNISEISRQNQRLEGHYFSFSNKSNERPHTHDKGYYEYSIIPNSLRKNPEYVMFYVYVFRLLILGMVPTILLIVLNYKIYKGIQHRNRRQLIMFPRKSNEEVHRRRLSRQEDMSASMFTAIVAIFLFCHSPRNILPMAEVILIQNSDICNNATITLMELEVVEPLLYEFPIWVHIGTSVSHLLLVIDSSTNALLYTFFNKEFRKHISRIMGPIAQLLGIAFSLCKRRCSRPVNNQGNENVNMAMVQIKVNGTDPNGKNTSVIYEIRSKDTFATLEGMPQKEEKIAVSMNNLSSNHLHAPKSQKRSKQRALSLTWADEGPMNLITNYPGVQEKGSDSIRRSMSLIECDSIVISETN